MSQADLASVLQAIHAGNQLMLVQFNEARMMEFAAAREQAEQFQQALSGMFDRSQTSQDSLGNSFAQRTDLMQQNLSAVTTVLNETLTSIQTDQQSRANVQTPAMSKSHPTRPPPRPKHDFSQIPAVDSTVSDPMSMAVHWRNTLRQIKITVEAGAADLAYHYKSEAENLPISGPDARFATYADRTSFADAVFQLVRRIPIDWLGENVKSAWNPDAPNTANIINNFNVEFVHNAYAESVRILEEWVYACLQARVEPQSSKTRLQVYEHSVHAHLKNRPSAAGSKALKDCVDDMDPTDENSGIVWQLEEMRFKPTGDAVQGMRARQTMQIRINFFYKNQDGTVNYQKKDDDKNIAQMINSVTDEQLFQDLRQKLIDDNPAVKNSRSLDRYIRKQRIGVTSLVSPSENMAMMMQQLHDGENDDIEPMRDVPALVE